MKILFRKWLRRRPANPSYLDGPPPSGVVRFHGGLRQAGELGAKKAS